jgi:hypothetical protein
MNIKTRALLNVKPRSVLCTGTYVYRTLLPSSSVCIPHRWPLSYDLLHSESRGCNFFRKLCSYFLTKRHTPEDGKSCNWHFYCLYYKRQRHAWHNYFSAFVKLQEAPVSLVMSVFLSARYNSAPTERIFMKIYILTFFLKSVDKVQVSLKSGKNEVRVLYMSTCTQYWSYLTHFFVEWEIFQTKVVEKIKTHILCPVFFF